MENKNYSMKGISLLEAPANDGNIHTTLIYCCFNCKLLFYLFFLTIAHIRGTSNFVRIQKQLKVTHHKLNIILHTNHTLCILCLTSISPKECSELTLIFFDMKYLIRSCRSFMSRNLQVNENIYTV